MYTLFNILKLLKNIKKEAIVSNFIPSQKSKSDNSNTRYSAMAHNSLHFTEFLI